MQGGESSLETTTQVKLKEYRNYTQNVMFSLTFVLIIVHFVLFKILGFKYLSKLEI